MTDVKSESKVGKNDYSAVKEYLGKCTYCSHNDTVPFQYGVMELCDTLTVILVKNKN